MFDLTRQSLWTRNHHRSQDSGFWVEKRTRPGLRTTMNIQSAINKDVFIPRDERLLVAVEVRRRKRKRMSFLPTGAKGDYATFICVSVTNTRPHQLLITKVKQFGGSSSFTRRSQWTVEQLRQVNGINQNKDSPEFDLVFDNAVDQWVASSSAEKCIFVQILFHACQTYWDGKAGTLGKAGKLGKQSPQGRVSQGAHRETGAGPSDSSPGSKSRALQARRKSYVPPKQTEFINCQSKLTGGCPCSFRCLHHESGHLPLQGLLESYEEHDGCKAKAITRTAWAVCHRHYG
ncbi:exocyst complex component 1-like isoform X3 [Seriola dumerili]|uniref:exocyst complex component 1-like isoform X3 n=1 Tax=Seriola dumerili TaxID=41447 RepID=UPI000BBE2405|nr:exocyst complex component 1-like isoform X3 [Seriola dumerili]